MPYATGRNCLDGEGHLSNHPTMRNKPCPCESGKKFKKCCGSEAAAAVFRAEERARQLEIRRARVLEREKRMEELRKTSPGAYSYHRSKHANHAGVIGWNGCHGLTSCQLVVNPKKPEDLIAPATAPTRRGWRYFECSECGLRWEWPSRDRFSPSGEDCPSCGEWVFPRGHREDASLPVDDSGNLKIAWNTTPSVQISE